MKSSARKAHKTRLQAWKDLGNVYLKGDKLESARAGSFFDQAINAFNQAIRLRPEYANAYLAEKREAITATHPATVWQ